MHPNSPRFAASHYKDNLGAVEKFPQKRRKIPLTSFHASDSMPGGGDSRKPSLVCAIVKKEEDCPKLQKGKRLQFFTKKKKKKGRSIRSAKNADQKRKTLGTLCAQIFVFSGATTQRRNNRDKQRKQQRNTREAARARSGAWLTWHLPRHGMANLASQSWFLLLGTRHVASRDGHVECCEVVFFLSGHEFLSTTTQKGAHA
jgi:hypothetical protein